MKLKLLTLMAGPDGTYNAGQIVDMSEAQAKELIDRGYAVACEMPAKKAVVMETATVQPQENTMVETEIKKRKKT